MYVVGDRDYNEMLEYFHKVLNTVQDIIIERVKGSNLISDRMKTVVTDKGLLQSASREHTKRFSCSATPRNSDT